ncbi:MAG: hypothetical protein HOG95_12810 [Rhodospirillaceae bacterium]|nr:hypothetical protein [Rhodospirillaceae bacterium]MBT5940803.1 hypothetical protein [Rhodospirillaceae bacterium]
MTNLAPNRLKADSHRQMSRVDQQKLIEGQLQLEDEDEARKRRVKLRKQRQAKLVAMRKAKRRARAFKLAGFWAAIIVGGFFAMVWYSNDVMALIK